MAAPTPMPSDARRLRKHHRLVFVLVGILLSLTSLACSLAAAAASDPFFTAPQGAINVTEPAIDTPLPTAWIIVPETPIPLPTSQVGQATATAPPSPTPAELPADTTPFLYYTMAGDTLPVVAVRFGVRPEDIQSSDPLPETALLNPGQLLIIPRVLPETSDSRLLLPDSEVVFSPSTVDFDIAAFADQAGGYLSTYREYLVSTGWTRGADVIARVALENSINPRLLLALLEYHGGWVYGQPKDQLHKEYPMGVTSVKYLGLYHQLTWVVNQFSINYYGWREGRQTELRFKDGASVRMAPELNAGSAALQSYFAQRYHRDEWLQALDVETGFPSLYQRMYGDPWVRAQNVEPLYPTDLQQPPLILPFIVNQIWAYTGGPHGAWERVGSQAAIDFAPGSLEPGCVKSDAWAAASAAGLVTRSQHSVVAIDLDGDGHEQTGWVLVYLHIAKDGRIPAGTWVQAGDPIGHPSCEGGFSTGTHIHFARKYNGEWIAADGPMPFELSGWRVHAGDQPYQGTMTRDGRTITASTLGPSTSRIIRLIDDP